MKLFLIPLFLAVSASAVEQAPRACQEQLIGVQPTVESVRQAWYAIRYDGIDPVSFGTEDLKRFARANGISIFTAREPDPESLFGYREDVIVLPTGQALLPEIPPVPASFDREP